MPTLTGKTPRGVLNPTAGEGAFRLARYLPSEDMRFFVEHHWFVEWDRTAQEPYLSETLPDACVNLVVESGRSGVFGVPTRRFSRPLSGVGRVFGVKFRPGAFHPFWRSPVSGLTDRVVALREAFGGEGDDLQRAILSLSEHAAVVEVAEAFLGGRRAERDPVVELVNEIAAAVATDRTILRVDDVADRFGMSRRTLQRLFERYVGVSPKWVIRRYRLHEAAERLARDEEVVLPALALDLGYFDQAHLTNDFRSIVGVTPAAYARRANATLP